MHFSATCITALVQPPGSNKVNVVVSAKGWRGTCLLRLQSPPIPTSLPACLPLSIVLHWLSRLHPLILSVGNTSHLLGLSGLKGIRGPSPAPLVQFQCMFAIFFQEGGRGGEVAHFSFVLAASKMFCLQ